MIRDIIVGLAITLILFPGVSMAQHADKERSAVAVAKRWLIMVDEGKYRESWEAAAEYFRTAVKQAQWVDPYRQCESLLVSSFHERSRARVTRPRSLGLLMENMLSSSLRRPLRTRNSLSRRSRL